jgi:superfamily II DNA or RNA helicase
MQLEFVPKEPDRAYIGNMLWLPKAKVQESWIKSALEFDYSGRTPADTQKIVLWKQTAHHIVCPREFLEPETYPLYDFPFIDIRPPPTPAQFEDLVEPRNADQLAAWTALDAHDDGVLNIKCGGGKTKLAVKKIANKQVKTLVIVPDAGILEQWKRSILGDKTPGRETSPGLRMNGPLGLIQGDVVDWDHDITLAVVTTLWRLIEKGLLPEEAYRLFSLIVFDEVHQIGAPKFSLTAPPWFGDRIGLTATVKRADALDNVYLSHIGQPFYSDLRQDLIPQVLFERTPIELDLQRALDKSGQVHAGKLRGLAGIDLPGNTYRYWKVREALERGRKILCLSHSKAQLKLFHAMFPHSGIITAETDRARRLDVIRDSRICFAIARLGSTGVDDDRLDQLFWLTPFNGATTLQQSMGRIQRALPGKPPPVFTVFEDARVKSLMGMCSGLKTLLRKWRIPFEIRAPLPLRPLPGDVQERYDNVFRTLTELDIADSGEDPGA